MGFDLSMVRTPFDIPGRYPDLIRDYPGYFRGIPFEELDEAGVLDYGMAIPKGPAWPPKGLTAARARKLRHLFDEQIASDEEPDADAADALKVQAGSVNGPGALLLKVNPTPRELRIMQRFLAGERQAHSAVSRSLGKVPAFKFGSNDGWHVIPEECLVIARGLAELLATKQRKGESWARDARPTMRLKFPHDKGIKNPTADQLMAAIDSLDHEHDDPFFILVDESRPNAFMQTKKTSARLFLVEYSECVPQQQFAAPKLAKAVVKQLFRSYLSRDESFKSMTEWTDITDNLFGDYYRRLEWVRAFAAFNELAAGFDGYEVW
jgi:hypothetical protein